jgi:hypothetical protein
MDDKLYLLFFVFWAIYELALCTVAATSADPFCQFDDDNSKQGCDGYNTAAAMYFFAFTSSCVAAFFFRAKDNKMYIAAVVSLIFDAFGWAGMYGAPSSAYCDDTSGNDALSKYCSGYEAATTFFIFAGFCYVAQAVLIRPGQEVLGKFPILAFFGGLALYSLGFLSFMGGESAFFCELSDDDVSTKRCNGFGFAAFVFALAFAATLAFLFFTFTQGPSVPSLWRYMLVYFNFFIFAFVAYFGANADANNSDSVDTNDGSASGYGFATFVLLVNFLVLLVHSASPMFKPEWYGPHKHFVFFLTLCLYAFALTAVYGGISSDGCDAGDDDFSNNTCDGFAMATFFSFMNFLVMIGACYFAFIDPSKGDEGDNDDGTQASAPPAKQEEVPEPVADNA